METEVCFEYQRRVQELVGFGHRGSATEREWRAARYLADELGGMGLASTQEDFRASRSLGVRLLVHVGVAAVGMTLLGRLPLATAAFSVIALISLFFEQTTRRSLLSSPFTRARSQNVVARVPVRSGRSKGRVILCAHYDTQRSGLLWNDALMKRLVPLLCKSPTILKSPFFPVTLAMLAQCLAGALAMTGAAPTVVRLLAGSIGLVYASASVLLAEWAVGAQVPGASDNASGAAAVLALGERWLGDPVTDIELVLLFTGCEEAGLLGAAAWVDRHRDEIRSLPTLFLNLDGLGFGPPRFLGQEVPVAGMPVPYPVSLLRLCQECADEMNLVHAGPHTTFGPTDGLAFLVRGIPGITIIGSGDGGELRAYHQCTDTPDRMDFQAAR